MNRGRFTLAVSAVALTLLAGCSSPTSTSNPQPTIGSTAITVGVGSATFKATLSADVFATDGLVITQQQVTSGAAAIPLLLNGQLQFTAADSVGALTAFSKGVPLVIVAIAASSGRSMSDDATGVLVKNDSPIRSAADLSGKTVAVNGIGNAAQLSAAAAIDKLGGDSTKVKFVEIPPNAMTAGVTNGTVDAAVASEPSLVQGAAAGLRTLFSPMAEALPAAPLFVYVASQSYLAQHRDIVERFAADMVEANKYVDRNPDFVRAVAVKTFNLTDAQVAKMILPRFVPASVETAGLQRVVDVMLKYKTITAPIDLSKAVLSP